MKTRIRVVCQLSLFILISSGSFGCRSRPPAPEQRFELKGKVFSIEKELGTVTISHEDIVGYMVAMTMPFKLKDPSLLNDLAEGDRIQATLVVAGEKTWLEDVLVTRETVDQSSLSDPKNQIEPKPGEEVPDFALVNQDGKRISLRKYRGHTVVLTFIYTRCPLPDYCPLMTSNFSEIERIIKSEPALLEKIRLLSVTVDPEYDTPKVLREYASAHAADTAQWDFATGTTDEVKRVAEYFGMKYWRDKDQVIHSLRTAIIDGAGKLVKLYRGNEWKPLQVVAELRSEIAAESK